MSMEDLKKQLNINSYYKMSVAELEEYLKGRRNREFAKKKGKGSYTRKKKHKGESYD